MAGGGGMPWQQIAGGAIATAGVAGVMGGALLHKEDDVEWMGPEIAGLSRAVLQRRGGEFLDIERDMALGLGDIGREAGRQQLFGTDETPGILDTIYGTQQRLAPLTGEEAMRRTGENIAAFRRADPILGSLSSQIQRDLELGGTLDPETRREVQQSVRSGQAARGFGFGASDVYEEMMNIGSMAEQRKRERQAAAMNLLAHPADPTSNAAANTIFTPFQEFNLATQLTQPQMLGPLGTQFGGTSGARQYFGGAPTKPDPADNRWSNALLMGGAGAMQVGGMVYGSGGGGMGQGLTQVPSGGGGGGGMAMQPTGGNFYQGSYSNALQGVSPY